MGYHSPIQSLLKFPSFQTGLKPGEWDGQLIVEAPRSSSSIARRFRCEDAPSPIRVRGIPESRHIVTILSIDSTSRAIHEALLIELYSLSKNRHDPRLAIPI